MTDPLSPELQGAESSSRQSDPFFSLAGSSHWNACVGRQGEERYYVDGYLEAAVELATAVIDKRLTGQRDTLVMPILFNARHGLELSLKHAARELIAGEIMNGPVPENHDIASQWEALAKIQPCDARLPTLVTALEPFVRSLAAVDADGQELRYHQRRDGAQSLADRSLVNVEVVLNSLKALQEILKELGYRAVDLVDERRSGTCTRRCSRSDLFAIARRLPPRAEWAHAAFDPVRAEIRRDFRLSAQQLSDALKVIQNHRELGAMIGLEFPLIHLDDESAIFTMGLWRSLHPHASSEEPSGIIRGINIEFEALIRDRSERHRAASTLVAKLSLDALADLETIYQMGRIRDWPERYEACLLRTKAEHLAHNSPYERAIYLLGKINLRDAVSACVARLGRTRLGEALNAV